MTEKVLVFADLHLRSQENWGKDTLFGKVSINSRTVDKLKKIVGIIKQENPDVLCIAGDAFDSYMPSETIRALFFKQVISLVPKAFLVSDNHSTKNGLILGTSESSISDKVTVINPGQALKYNQITMIGYTRDDEEFDKLCHDNSNTILIAHRTPKPNENFAKCFLGHEHLHAQVGNAFSIGSLFIQNWNEELYQPYYLIIQGTEYEFKKFDDIKIKTFNKVENVPDGQYHAIRFKIEDKAHIINAINKKEIRANYKETYVDFDLKVVTEEIKAEEKQDINKLIDDLLKDKNLTDKELDFGKKILEEVECL